MGQRYKTYVGTGQAPNGRVYPLDLNSIQDMKADQSDYAARINLGVLGIGEAGLQLLRSAASVAQLTGSLIVNALLQGDRLTIAGSYTNAQIANSGSGGLAAGTFPARVIIWNSDNGRLEWNVGTDSARNFQALGRDSTGRIPFGSTPDAWIQRLAANVLKLDSISVLGRTMTTAQRNAIAAGSRPPGSAIWNSDISDYEVNKGSDATPSWTTLGEKTQIVTSIADAGAVVDGKIIAVRVGTDFIVLIGNTALGKWVSQPIAGPAGSFSNVAAVNTPNSILSSAIVIPNFHDINAAGLKPQFQFSLKTGTPSNTHIYDITCGIWVHDNAEAGGGTRLGGTAVMAHVIQADPDNQWRDAGWTDIGALSASTKANAIASAEYNMNSTSLVGSPATTQSLPFIEIQMRWVG